MCYDDGLPDEYYIWEDFTSTKNFNRDVWKHFQIAVKFGRIRWIKYAKCKLCKTLVGWSRCTGNLKKHLNVHHSNIENNPEDPLIDTVVSKPPLEYLEFLQNKFREMEVNDPQQYVAGGSVNRLSKNPLWNLYLLNRYSKVYVRCRVCGKDVYWNQRGLEKLKTHTYKNHVEVPSDKRRSDIRELFLLNRRS